MWVPIQGIPPESFSWLQLTGFILLVCGTLVYNEIVVIPYLGFDKNTKAAREKRSKRAEGLLTGTIGDGATNQYMAVSPHAAYDAARNMRKVAHKIEDANRFVDNAGLGLNKSELTVEETSTNNKSHISYQSAPTYNKD